MTMKTAYFGNFLFVSVWILSTILILSPLQNIIATPDEDQFVNLYGNDANTSGIWQRARDLALTDAERLKNISFQAHTAVWPYYRGGIQIDTAFVTTKTLMFPGAKYSDIYVDLIGYTLVGLPKVTFYLTKGLKPDCVFYCWNINRNTTKYELKNQVCELCV